MHGAVSEGRGRGFESLRVRQLCGDASQSNTLEPRRHPTHMQPAQGEVSRQRIRDRNLSARSIAAERGRVLP